MWVKSENFGKKIKKTKEEHKKKKKLIEIRKVEEMERDIESLVLRQFHK